MDRSASITFSDAFRCIAPYQEYLLQGSILDTSCEVLLHRLRGLCDNADTTPQTFSDYEAVYQLSKLFSPTYVHYRQLLLFCFNAVV